MDSDCTPSAGGGDRSLYGELRSHAVVQMGHVAKGQKEHWEGGGLQHLIQRKGHLLLYCV